jgi:hypothetical protein
MFLPLPFPAWNKEVLLVVEQTFCTYRKESHSVEKLKDIWVIEQSASTRLPVLDFAPWQQGQSHSSFGFQNHRVMVQLGTDQAEPVHRVPLEISPCPSFFQSSLRGGLSWPLVKNSPGHVGWGESSQS